MTANQNNTPRTDKHRFRLGESEHFAVHEVYVKEIERKNDALRVEMLAWASETEQLRDKLEASQKLLHASQSREAGLKLEAQAVIDELKHIEGYSAAEALTLERNLNRLYLALSTPSPAMVKCEPCKGLGYLQCNQEYLANPMCHVCKGTGYAPSQPE